MTIGVTLWATGVLSKPKGEPTRQAEKAQVASTTPDGALPADKKAQASHGSGRDDTFQAIYREGQKLLDDGELGQAVATFGKAIQCKPDAASGYNARGVAYLRQNRLGRALSDFNEAIRLDPKLAKYYANRALVYRDQENYGLALADHNRCIELSPTSGGFYEERGTTYYAMEKKDEAESDFATARRLNEKTPAGTSGAALAVSKPGKKSSAAKTVPRDREKAISTPATKPPVEIEALRPERPNGTIAVGHEAFTVLLDKARSDEFALRDLSKQSFRATFLSSNRREVFANEAGRHDKYTMCILYTKYDFDTRTFIVQTCLDVLVGEKNLTQYYLFRGYYFNFTIRASEDEARTWHDLFKSDRLRLDIAFRPLGFKSFQQPFVPDTHSGPVTSYIVDVETVEAKLKPN